MELEKINLKPQVHFLYNSNIMNKSIMKLTKKVGDSLSSHLRVGVKNLLVIGEIDKVGLVPVLDWTPARWSLGLGLNFLYRQ